MGWPNASFVTPTCTCTRAGKWHFTSDTIPELMARSNVRNGSLDHPRRWKQPSLDVLSCLFSPLLVSNYPSQAGFGKSWLYPVVVGPWAQLDLELLMLKFILIPHIPLILPLWVLCSWSIPTSLFPCYPFPPKLGTSRNQNTRNYPQVYQESTTFLKTSSPGFME